MKLGKEYTYIDDMYQCKLKETEQNLMALLEEFEMTAVLMQKTIRKYQTVKEQIACEKNESVGAFQSPSMWRL